MKPLDVKHIEVQFTDEQIKRFNKDKFKLCFSSGISGNDVSNVIAYSEFISAYVAIDWVNSYKIAGTKRVFQPGATITTNTKPLDIEVDQTWTLPADWTNGEVKDEDGLDGNSFKMINGTKTNASAVVYKLINNKLAPFYISSAPLEPGGSEVMTPKQTVSLWFAKDVDAGTMTSKNSSEVSMFDFQSTSSKIVHYDNSGKFVGGPI